MFYFVLFGIMGGLGPSMTMVLFTFLSFSLVKVRSVGFDYDGVEKG